jgi:hypothetical protein
MYIQAVSIKAKDLKPGDMFSTASQAYWDERDEVAIGEKVYIRTEAACPEDQAEDEIYQIHLYPDRPQKN